MVHMRCDLGSYSLGGELPLVGCTWRRIGGRWNKVGKLTLGPSEVPRRGVENGVLLGKTGGPTTRLFKAALTILGRLENGTRKDGGRWCLFRRGRLSVWMITKAVGSSRSAGGLWKKRAWDLWGSPVKEKEAKKKS